MNQFRAIVTLLLFIALVTLRIGGAHLHWCFDGQEPTASVHLADAGDFDEHSATGVAHEDVNSDVSGDGASKLRQLDLPPLALLIAVSLLLLGWRRVAPLPHYIAPLFASVSSRLPPPLRGPPLNSVV